MPHWNTVPERRRLIAAILLSALSAGSALRAEPSRTAPAALVVSPQAVLTSPDPTSFFGWSVALSADGRTAVVGTADSDRAYVFVQSGGVWILDSRLPPSGPGGSRFGNPVAISADGMVVLVANTTEPCLTSFSCGAVYAYSRKSGVWTQEAHLTPPSAFDFEFAFGVSLALSADGSTALVGRLSDLCFPAPCRGAVYIYSRDAGGVWSPAGKLAAPVPSNDSFGASSALSSDGNTALIGAPQSDCPSALDCGKAYAFVRSGGTWSLQAELTASDPHLGAFFGTSVALSADGTLGLIGSPENGTGLVRSSVYEFVQSGGSWTERQKIASPVPGADAFGRALSLSANGLSALIGAPETKCGGNFNCGAVYSITRHGGSWSSPMSLLSFSPGSLGGFSVALSADGGIGLVGAPGAPCGGSSCGEVFVLALPLPVTSIPAASEGGLALLALLLAASGAWVLARRRRSA